MAAPGWGGPAPKAAAPSPDQAPRWGDVRATLAGRPRDAQAPKPDRSAVDAEILRVCEEFLESGEPDDHPESPPGEEHLIFVRDPLCFFSLFFSVFQ